MSERLTWGHPKSRRNDGTADGTAITNTYGETGDGTAINYRQDDGTSNGRRYGRTNARDQHSTVNYK